MPLMTMNRCPTCGAEMDATASICTRCQQALAYSLANVSAYWQDLSTVRTRQTRYSASGGTRGAETPLGLDLRFAPGGIGTKADDATRNALSTWTRVVLDNLPPVEGPTHGACQHRSCAIIRQCRPPRADSVPAMCAYLLSHSDWIRVSPYGDEVYRDITAAERLLERVIDRPAESRYAGVCSAETPTGLCPADLYAKPDQEQMTCPACRTVHDVAERRALLLTYAESVLATTAEIARAVIAWSDPTHREESLVKRIGAWATRGRLDARGHVDVAGRRRPLYRIGDVLELLTGDVRRGDKRAS